MLAVIVSPVAAVARCVMRRLHRLVPLIKRSRIPGQGETTRHIIITVYCVLHHVTTLLGPVAVRPVAKRCLLFLADVVISACRNEKR